MKVLIILLITTSCTDSSSKFKKNELLSTAVLDVANELFTRHRIEFEILIFDKVSPQVIDVIDGLRKGALLTNHKRYEAKQRLTVFQPLLIFCESLEKVKEFYGLHPLGDWKSVV